MMENLIHSFTGLIHLISSFTALILGTAVITATKGTMLHKRMGYGYALSMIILNGTAFMIYHLFGKWGPFHYAALVSAVTLAGGMIPVIARWPLSSWIYLHISFMYYSVIGLYAAFASEVLVRIPGIGFWWMVMGATLLVMAVGVFFFQIKSKKWFEQYKLKDAKISHQENLTTKA